MSVLDSGLTGSGSTGVSASGLDKSFSLPKIPVPGCLVERLGGPEGFSWEEVDGEAARGEASSAGGFPERAEGFFGGIGDGGSGDRRSLRRGTNRQTDRKPAVSRW